jgi:hypothetical protein
MLTTELIIQQCCHVPVTLILFGLNILIITCASMSYKGAFREIANFVAIIDNSRLTRLRFNPCVFRSDVELKTTMEAMVPTFILHDPFGIAS